MADDESSDQKAKVNSMELPKRISVYTVLVAFICIFIIGYVIADGRHFKLFNKKKDQNTITKPEESDKIAEGYHRLGIYLLVIFSGAFGGCLYNFRGIKKHLEENDFESNFAHRVPAGRMIHPPVYCNPVLTTNHRRSASDLGLPVPGSL